MVQEPTRQQEVLRENKPKFRFIRIQVDEGLYQKLKLHCIEHGDLSRLTRSLLRKWVGSPEAAVELNKLRL
jgi:hypothetical protein